MVFSPIYQEDWERFCDFPTRSMSGMNLSGRKRQSNLFSTFVKSSTRQVWAMMLSGADNCKERCEWHRQSYPAATATPAPQRSQSQRGYTLPTPTHTNAPL